MNRIFVLFSLLVTIFLFACNETDATAKTAPQNAGTDSANFTQVQWMDTVINFGTITKGEKVQIVYKCKNTGSKPLFIYSVRPGCGCTVAEYTKAAIAPGGMGEVNAEYDSNRGIPGEIRKTITVNTNTTNPSPHLVFTGTVNAAPGTNAKDTTKKSS